MCDWQSKCRGSLFLGDIVHRPWILDEGLGGDVPNFSVIANLFTIVACLTIALANPSSIFADMGPCKLTAITSDNHVFARTKHALINPISCA